MRKEGLAGQQRTGIPVQHGEEQIAGNIEITNPIGVGREQDWNLKKGPSVENEQGQVREAGLGDRT